MYECFPAVRFEERMEQKPFIAISPVNPDPLYKQVTDQIKDAIASGALGVGTRLPSIREMSRELGISPITIKRAYHDLENEGYIITRSGLGSFVAEVSREKMRVTKLTEIRRELARLVAEGERFGIPVGEIGEMIRDMKDDGDG